MGDAQSPGAKDKYAILDGTFLRLHTTGITGNVKHPNIPDHQRQPVPALLTGEAPQEPWVAGQPAYIAVRNVQATHRHGVWRLAETVERVGVRQDTDPRWGGQEEAGMPQPFQPHSARWGLRGGVHRAIGYGRHTRHTALL